MKVRHQQRRRAHATAQRLQSPRRVLRLVLRNIDAFLGRLTEHARARTIESWDFADTFGQPLTILGYKGGL